MKTTKSRNVGLDLLRIAAMAIVLWVHTSVYARVPGAFPVRNTIGPFSVEMFFVMSGYLYGRGFFKASEQFSMRKFYIGRILRILPVYFLALFFTHWVSGDEIQPICFFLLQNLDEGALGFLPTAWSLCVEEWSYLVLAGVYLLLVAGFDLLVYLKREKCIRVQNIETDARSEIAARMGKKEGEKSGKTHKSAMLIAAITVIAIALIVRTILVLKDPVLDWDYGLRKQTLPRMDVFAYGILAAYIEKEKPELYKKYLVSRRGALAAAVLCAMGAFAAYKFIMGAQNGLAKIGYFTVLPLGVLLVMLLVKDMKCLQSETAMRLSPVISFLSALTYPLYLVHFPLYIHYSDICHRLEIQNRGPMIAKTIVICIAIAAAVHVVVEIPLGKLKKVLTK